jgi:hypothetical protein
MEDADGRYLYQKDLFLPLSGVAKKSEAMKDEEWEILDRKALGTIQLSMEASVAFNISKENTMKRLMDALGKLYEKPSVLNKVFLMKRLFNMKMSEGGSVADHLNEFNTITNQLSFVKVYFDDEVRALPILCSLPERWNGLVMAVSNSVSSSNTLKFDDVVGVILSEEMRWKSIGETSGNALNMENRGRQKDRGKGSGNHGNSRKGRSNSRLGKFDRFMTEQGYSRCHSNHCVYFKKLENGSFIILLLYVDDMLVAGSNMQDINVLKKKLANSFAMKDLGAAKKILGMRITRDKKNRKLTLSRGEYTKKVLERFRM